MNNYTILIVIAISVIILMSVVYGLDVIKMSISVQDHAIFVDPIVDNQNLFVTGRVSIQNIGAKPLTNIHINFGDGDILDIALIKPGDKIIVSPPSDNSMQFVMITADNDIFVNKAYRTPPKMVGMMGS